MNKLCAWLCCLLAAVGDAYSQEKVPPTTGPSLPAVLKDWQGWALWPNRDLECPSIYNSAGAKICYWPSRLILDATEEGASWSLDVTAYSESWVSLPGTTEYWPRDTTDNNETLVVLEKESRPAVKVVPGSHVLKGKLVWNKLPEKISLPPEIGIIELKVRGQTVAVPLWDGGGDLWLQRNQQVEPAQNQMEVEVHRLLEDGIPLWLHSDIIVSVAGKSREESLGTALPEGWIVSSIESPIPVAIDDLGKMRAQVRAGKWTIQVHAFRTSDAKEIKFADRSTSIIDQELIGYRAKPDYRVAEIQGLTPVDVTQTTFPEKWRGGPVFAWETKSPFQLVEKMRGMGDRRPAGLTIQRRLWLDDDGAAMTFSDNVSGVMQIISRLDVADGQELGSVQIAGQGQLITANPQSKSPGVEIRNRNLNLNAIGRMADPTSFAATGWQADADQLQATIYLPPGWRMFALFGADSVDGDWLTAWTLLDLFFVLVFSIAVYRLWGWVPGLLAIVALTLSFQEFGAPRLAWIFLLIPIALLRVVPPGTLEFWIRRLRVVAVAALLLLLVPFVARQVQSLLYPQLELPGVAYSDHLRWLPIAKLVVPRSAFVARDHFAEAPFVQMADQPMLQANESAAELEPLGKSVQEPYSNRALYKSANLQNSREMRIQTGPAEPEWDWGVVQCYWTGTVAASQKIRPVLISLGLHRVMTILRILSLAALASVLIGSGQIQRRSKSLLSATSAGLTALAVLLANPGNASAQLPTAETIEGLRQRLLETPDAFPKAAEISQAVYSIQGNRITIKAEVHAGMTVAVPLPGRLPDWSPVSVKLDGQSAAVSRREGFLWLVIPKGVHQVNIEGLLPETSEWQIPFHLKPRVVEFQSLEGWEAKGVSEAGVPNDQIILRRLQPTAASDASYDRRDFAPITVLERSLEFGLMWRVHNRVSRLGGTTKAISQRYPLLPGERVLNSNAVVDAGMVEVNLGEGENEAAWDSELPITSQLDLVSSVQDTWIERWFAVTSPVWNITYSGLAPILEANVAEWIPAWNPWPGESVQLKFSKPDAIPGDLVTVKRVSQVTNLGHRQQVSQLQLHLNSSLGGDFAVDLDPQAVISDLKRDQQPLPVRRDGAKLIIPTQPGTQNIQVNWRTDRILPTDYRGESVTLPVESANITNSFTVPESRWVLWADGPLRGPAVRMWVILVFAIFAALILGRLKLSPLKSWEWILLVIGLTQVTIFPALVVVAWFFALAARGKTAPNATANWRFNLVQIVLAIWTAAMLLVLVVAVGRGLLGSPMMFIVGNNSSQTFLNWFEPRGGVQLPMPRVVSISVWYYRLAMLAWALWLASALLGWLQWGWQQYAQWGLWRKKAIVSV